MPRKSDNPFKGSKILLVEDEASLAIGLQYNLEAEGYETEWVTDGLKALEAFAKDGFDLILLDIMLPHLDGFNVAERIREQSPQIPILILTARTGVMERLRGLKLGADDYISKPFNLEELLLRIRGMLKRKMWYKESADRQSIYRFGRNEVNFLNLHARNGRQQFQLTLHEAMVLKYLIEHKGEVVSRSELLENVWKISSEIETRTVDNFIVRLRKYFEPNPAKPTYIKSIRSAGYIFTADV